MFSYWRVLILLTIILGAVFSIGLKVFPYGRDGVEIVYIAKDSPAKGILEQGMFITQLNGKPVVSLQDWNSRVLNLTGNVTVMANAKSYKIFVKDNIGVDVIGIERTNLDFGLDLRGGTRIILKPEGNVTEAVVSETIGVLETRANLFGLREIKFIPAKGLSGDYFIQIEAAGVGNDVVDELLTKQGKFEAKVAKPVSSTDMKMVLGSNSYNVRDLGNGTVMVDNITVRENGTFVLQGIEFQYLNHTASSYLFMGKIFDSNDIELVYTDAQRSGVIPQGNSYQFYFGLLISQDGAQRFADITTGIPKFFDVNSGEEYLDSSLQMIIDGNVVSSLRISGSLQGQAIQSPQVSGSETSLDSALQEKLRLQTILKSGAPPVPLTLLSVDVISPTLGEGFFVAAIFSFALAAIVVLVIVFVRYRVLKISIPMVLIAASEAVIILGIAATNDAFIWIAVLAVNVVIIMLALVKKQHMDIQSWVGAVLIPLLGLLSWTIDLPAIAGIIAVMGTGINHLIIIADQALREKGKVYGIREQLKAAFFIIFGAAATVVAAMIPLMFVGVGLVRGFAITTIVGVLVGVLVTRPAYANITERMVSGSKVETEA